MITAVPAGHSTAAHLLLGACSRCTGTSLDAEIDMWRAWASRHVPEVTETTRDYFVSGRPR